MAKKYICIFALFLGVICLLFGCSPSEDAGYTGEFQSLWSDSPTEGEQATDAPEKIEKIYLLLPAQASAELARRANELAGSISEKLGANVVVKYEYESGIYFRDEIQILLGKTAIPESIDYISRLRCDDYVCKWNRNCLVLGGRHEDATMQAIDFFITTILPSSTPQSLMSRDVNYERLTNYPIESISINGYDLYDYVLVYSNDTGVEAFVAEKIRDTILKKSGYLLDVLPSDAAWQTVGKAISIGDALVESDTKELFKSAISTVDGNISIWGCNPYMLSVAAADFLSGILCADEAGSVTLDASRQKLFDVPTPSLGVGVGYANVLSPSPHSITEITLRLAQGEDMLFLGKVDEILKNDLQTCLSSQYTCRFFEHEGSSYALILRNSAQIDAKGEFSGDALILDLSVPPLHEEYRMIYLPEGATADVSELINSSKAFLLISDCEPSCTLPNAELFETYSWTFGGKTYKRTLFVDKKLTCRLCGDEEVNTNSSHMTRFWHFLLEYRLCQDLLDLTNAEE